MNQKALSIRPFIGAKDFETSRNFYREIGFKETVIDPSMSVFEIENISFYLQNAYVKDWIDNTMIFLEVDDIDRYWNELLVLRLPERYKSVKLSPIKDEDWGRECFLHDPSGILWHFGVFKS